MHKTDLLYFELLKKEISLTLQKSHPGLSSSIHDWKGQDIILFQEDLIKCVNGQVSEKWFYTHLKSSGQKLPRIDMLIMLSKYAGYSGWTEFKLKHFHDIPKKNAVKLNSKFLSYIILIIILLGTITWAITKIFNTRSYTFCFIDSDRKTAIQGETIEIILLYDGESPVEMKCDSLGHFKIKTRKQKIRFIVKTPYYKTDTITRIVNKRRKNENIKLRTNDYALMIHYFSTSNITDWNKRRKQLDNMFANNVQIYQVFDKNNSGMELYNKQEFINKLTMPVNSLKNIEIIETIYTGNKISMLRFRQLNNK